MTNTPILRIVLSGAWSDADVSSAACWQEHVIHTFSDSIGEYVGVVTYDGPHLHDCFQQARERIISIRDDYCRRYRLADCVIRLCGYSRAGQIARLLARINSLRVESVILIASFGAHGIPIEGFASGFRAVPYSLLKGLITGQVELTESDLLKLLFNEESDERDARRLAKDLIRNGWMHPMRRAHAMELGIPGFRQYTPPIEQPTAVVLGDQDLLVREETYLGDNVVSRQVVPGADHGIIFCPITIKERIIEAQAAIDAALRAKIAI